ncbi:tyrosine phosphatase-like protein [Aspergillus campestris IBT 28561]|uniref:Very-long-chain (3R)-3-hydroxyacyl-CoA dehydratase n=1 Tax=Aspergillus campestris (strain IBT 28561) TaxID=1392248 RepID=A0A2I1CYH0_ASPC2|nr:tyrosine phosphatase-like protein [Aspergillus campestris IBT 28561]PKY02679.1 tyrosine phosphatase-like protein [Aspergillus campestris IBT 28561]
MPPKTKGPTGLTRLYLLAYNALSFTLWATCLARGAQTLLATASPTEAFTALYSPLLTTTQSLAALEILHSLTGLVRAPVATTAMQVSSRLLLVWGIMYPFRAGGVAAAGEGIVGGDSVQMGDYAFLGCLVAWGITECIRYGFFVLSLSGVGVPGFWTWLRYNTFYVLYPLGISSECTLVVKALEPAAEWNPLLWWAFVVVLGIYVPGSYILYTHMMAQRRKVMQKKD